MSQGSLSASASTEGVSSQAGVLKRACLSYTEVLAQSVSVIAPSTVPAAVIGLIYARAGNATWLSMLLGMLGLILVSFNVNQFARRSASPGSLYSYIAQGLSPTSGVLGGWALLFGYTLTGMSTLCGFALIANVLLSQLFGVQVPVVALFAVGALAAYFIAVRDIQFSAKTMLLFEAASLLFVLVLGGLIWARHGFAIDWSQLTLEGATPGGALGGVALAVFGFSGFESSTALGDEAKDPLRSIPRSVLQSVALAGAFFIGMSYVIVLGFQNGPESLAHSEAPLTTLAVSIGWGTLGNLLNVGILLSFFACTLASINSTARILFTMARHGLISQAIGSAHVENRTPHVAVALSTLITFAVPAVLVGVGFSAFDCQGHFGTLCSFGFIVVYILISVAAPYYLRGIGALTPRALAYSVGGVAFMLLPLIGSIGIPGSELLPPPDEVGVVLVLVFALYMAAGAAWLVLERARRPKMIVQMQNAIDTVHRQFALHQRALETMDAE